MAFATYDVDGLNFELEYGMCPIRIFDGENRLLDFVVISAGQNTARIITANGTFDRKMMYRIGAFLKGLGFRFAKFEQGKEAVKVYDLHEKRQLLASHDPAMI